jgi:hypothetical protein
MFTIRGYMGWITDMIAAPRAHDPWPSISIDQRLIDDYIGNYAYMQEIGINTLGVWGFFVAREWPVEVEQAIDQERAGQIGYLFEQAHTHDIKVLSGLGVYSWGFEAIIRANPHLSRGNPRALCPSIPVPVDSRKLGVAAAGDRLRLQLRDRRRYDAERRPGPLSVPRLRAVGQHRIPRTPQRPGGKLYQGSLPRPRRGHQQLGHDLRGPG